MKPVQIVLLVVAGALGGAVITTQVRHKPQQPRQVAAADVPHPATPPATAPAPQPAAAAPSTEPVVMPEAQKAAAESEKPSPAAPPVRHEARREPPKARPIVRPNAPPPANPRPVETAHVETTMPKPTTVHAPAAPPPQPQPASSTPPARTEPEQATPPPPPPPPPAPQVTLNAGVLLPVRLVDGLSSERNLAGDTFTGTLDKELLVDGFVIAERGARVDGRVVNVDRGGKVRGVAAMAIELTRIHLSDGQVVAIQTDAFDRHA